MTPEEAYQSTLNMWKARSKDFHVCTHKMCGFCRFHVDLLNQCKKRHTCCFCPVVRVFGFPCVRHPVWKCDPELGEIQSWASEVVEVLEANKQALIEAGYEILKEIGGAACSSF